MQKRFYVWSLVALCCCTMTRDGEAQTTIFGSTRAQVEPHIAVNPTNPNNIIIVVITSFAQNRIGAFYTTGGGQSWSGNEDITTENADAADPLMAFDESRNS